MIRVKYTRSTPYDVNVLEGTVDCPSLFQFADSDIQYAPVEVGPLYEGRCFDCAFNHLNRRCYSAPRCSKGDPQYDYLTDRYLENSNRQCYYVIVSPPDIEYVAPEIESIQI